MKGCTFFPAYELVMITDPPSRAISASAVVRTVFQTPITLMSMVSRKLSAVISS